MLKYQESMVVFSEIPDEITLAINISNCPIQCPDCHSKELWKDKGTELSQRKLERLISENSGISCVCFMGGDSEPDLVNMLAERVKQLGLKSAWYSGKSELPKDTSNFNFIKIGPYIKERGPLNSETTNQILYQITEDGPVNITSKLWIKN